MTRMFKNRPLTTAASMLLLTALSVGAVATAQAQQCLYAHKVFPRATIIAAPIVISTTGFSTLSVFAVAVNDPNCRELYAALRTPGSSLPAPPGWFYTAAGLPIYAYEGWNGPSHRI